MDRHFLQTKASYCVPACIVMVEAWRGTLHAHPDERQHQLFATLSVGGLCSLDAATTILPNEGCGEPDIDDAQMVDTLATLVQADRRAIITCWPGPLGDLLRARGLSSPHGVLPDGSRPHHAIYVFGASGEHFDIYDPWHEPEGQPLRLSWDELATAWTRMMLVATK